MAEAKKLPSGSWRVQVFSHYEYVQNPDGTTKKKRIYESFTCDDPSNRGKRKCEADAAAWAAERKNNRPENISVYNAISKYIQIKEPVLSKTTIAGYLRMQRLYFASIGDYRLRELDQITVQSWVGDLSARLSPKSVRNIYGLLSSTVEMFCPSMRLSATLPAKIKPDLYTPNDEDIKKLLLHIQGKELEIAVMLAAFGPMRRGEICALESSDISGNIVTVRRNMVLDINKEWSIKQPKNYSSYREILYPDFVIDRLAGIEGRIIKATPDQITGRFRRAVYFAGLPHFRFHDLRHYAASIMHAIGIQDQYIMARGGWKTDSVMKSVYRNVIDLEAAKQNKKINNHFKSMQHDMQHG